MIAPCWLIEIFFLKNKKQKRIYKRSLIIASECNEASLARKSPIRKEKGRMAGDIVEEREIKPDKIFYTCRIIRSIS